MFAPLYLRTVDTHAEGMPLRVVVEGLPPIPGHTMAERLDWARENLDWVRELLVSEPRGHGPMMYAILTPPTQPEADFGVLYMSGGGFWSMCGHGTIGVVTMLVERGLVARNEPEAAVTLDTAVGLIVTKVRVEGRKAVSVSFNNVPSYVLVEDAPVHMPPYGDIKVSVAYGGNVYAMIDVEQLGLPLELQNLSTFIDLGLNLVKATRDQVPINPPAGANLGQMSSSLFMQAADGSRPARNLMVKEPRYFDRSPCGTGTSVRMALAYSRGELGLNEPRMFESIIGSRFEGCILGTTTVQGIPAINPQITGRAWLVGSAEFTVDPTDIFPRGFRTIG
jgi:proline racemase